MAQKEKATQRHRQHKESKGKNSGGGKMDRPLTDIEKINLGGGMLKRFSYFPGRNKKVRKPRFDRSKGDE